MPKHTNKLINQSSPYLLQHAHNPVNWLPWSDESLGLAKQEQKLILISIGYAACHWCHVMEKESFEDEEVAKLMNERFICIKVDREERPDVDAYYMEAVQMMQGQGGWPLNCFALPDGKPVWGGTYFRKNQWMGVLQSVASLYKNRFHDLMEQAAQLQKGLESIAVLPYRKQKTNLKNLTKSLKSWQNQFDMLDGGFKGAPKFPMPVSISFLHDYQLHFDDEKIRGFVDITLRKMALGGLYDAVGGGFARYSTDRLWKVPHFEKMLYDNAQLIGLYARAAKSFKQEFYLKTAKESFAFLERELKSPEGLFCSSLDADSEGEEGAFYVWTDQEFNKLLQEDAKILKDYFGIGDRGLWENGKNILYAEMTPGEFARQRNINTFAPDLEKAKNALFDARSKRVRPARDDKQICSWNALMLEGLLHLYEASSQNEYLEKALQLANNMLRIFRAEDGGLYRIHKQGKSSILAFLDDYAFTIRALLHLYQLSFQEGYLNAAKELAQYCIHNFLDQASGMYFYTHRQEQQLSVRKQEFYDNVTPSSNAVLAHSFYELFLITGEHHWQDMSMQMLQNVSAKMDEHLPAFSEWAALLLKSTQTVFILKMRHFDASNILDFRMQMPYVVSIPQAEDADNSYEYYLCHQNACFLATNDVGEVIEKMKFYEGSNSARFGSES